MAFSKDYYESCEECNSLNLSIVDDYIEDGYLWFHVLCRDCGAQWEDRERVED